MGSFIAMDAEQERDEAGKFSATRSSVVDFHKSEAGRHKSEGNHSKAQEHEAEADKVSKIPNMSRLMEHNRENERKRLGRDEAPPFPSTLQGEAGRQARKVARDCMSGRFRP